MSPLVGPRLAQLSHLAYTAQDHRKGMMLTGAIIALVLAFWMKRLYGPLRMPKDYGESKGLAAIFSFLVVSGMLFYVALR